MRRLSCQTYKTRRHKKSPSISRRAFQISGADTKSRTRDLLITSQLLYQLSYVGTNAAHFMELAHAGQALKYFFFKSFQ